MYISAMEYLYILYTLFIGAFTYTWGATLETPPTLHRIKRNEIDGMANSSIIAKDFFKLHSDSDHIDNNLNQLHSANSNMVTQTKKEAPKYSINSTSNVKSILPRKESTVLHKKLTNVIKSSPVIGNPEALNSKKDKSVATFAFQVDAPLSNEPHVAHLFEEVAERERDDNVGAVRGNKDHYVSTHYQEQPFFAELSHFERLPHINHDDNIKRANIITTTNTEPNYSLNSKNNNDNVDNVKNQNAKTDHYSNNWFTNENQANQHQQHNQLPSVQLQPNSNHLSSHQKSLQLHSPGSGSAQLQVWNTAPLKTLTDYSPMDKILKFANMMFYKVGIDKPQFHAAGAQLLVNPNYGNYDRPNTVIGIGTPNNGNSNLNANALTGELDDLNKLDYLCNAIDMPPVNNIAHSLFMKPTFTLSNDATLPFNLLENTLDMLMDSNGATTSGIENDSDTDDEVEIRCPVHHESRSTDTGEEKRSDKDKNGLIEVCSCRLIKNPKK